MPIPRNLSLLPGDVVLIPATVKYQVEPGAIDLALSAGKYLSDVYATRDDVELVSTAIKVGDEVCPFDQREPERLELSIAKAVIDGKVWLAMANGLDCVVELTSVRRTRTRDEIASAESDQSEQKRVAA